LATTTREPAVERQCSPCLMRAGAAGEMATVLPAGTGIGRRRLISSPLTSMDHVTGRAVLPIAAQQAVPAQSGPAGTISLVSAVFIKQVKVWFACSMNVKPLHAKLAQHCIWHH
jgi:hypothetical protein